MTYTKVFASNYKLLVISWLLLISHSLLAQEISAIDTILDKSIEGDNFSGSVLLAKNGVIIYSRTVGFADREKNLRFTNHTSSSIASVGKMFTAVLIMQLVEAGKIDLSKPIDSYLPSIKIPNKNVITVEQLLNHSSGLGNYMNHPRFTEVIRTALSADALITLVEETPLANNEPGVQYEYSNSGYILLGKIIEKVTGLPYVDAVSKHIALTAGMQRLHFNTNLQQGVAKGYQRQKPGERWNPTPFLPFPASDGGVFTTADDLFKFDKALYSNKLIKPGSLGVMHDKIVDANLPGLGKMKYGFGAMRFDYDNGVYSWGHNGGFPGYACEYKHYFFPDKTEYTLIILSNYDRVVRPILFELQKMILDKKV